GAVLPNPERRARQQPRQLPVGRCPASLRDSALDQPPDRFGPAGGLERRAARLETRWSGHLQMIPSATPFRRKETSWAKLNAEPRSHSVRPGGPLARDGHGRLVLPLGFFPG